MKNINKVEQREEMSEVIQGLFLDFNPIVAWQIDNSSQRIISPVKITDVSNDNDTLSFKSAKDEELVFSKNPILFYSEEQKVIFKTTLQVLKGCNFTVEIPNEIKKFEDTEEKALGHMLNIFSSDTNFVGGAGLGNFSFDDDELVEGSGLGNIDEQTHLVQEASNGTEHISSNVKASISTDNIKTNMTYNTTTEHINTNWVTKSMSQHDADLFNTELSYINLDEEDKIFEGVRDAPRAKPPEGKMVTVQLDDDTSPQSTYVLYDLSKGGLSFLVFAKDEFQVDTKLLIKAFDTNKFENPMLTEIKAIREADDMGIQYKVGCQFLESEGLEEPDKLS